MLSTEKTPVLHLNKMPNEEKSRNSECGTRTTISWVFVTVLTLLLIVLIIQFFYSPFDRKVKYWAEEAVEVNVHGTFGGHRTNRKNKVSDPWDLDFLLDPSSLCATLNPPDSQQYAKDPEVKLLMLVPSAVDHFEQRKAVRNTWGSVAEKPFGPMRLGFVLGTTSNRTVNLLIQEESLENRDIIQADFQDGRNTMTTKAIVMLKWVAKRCPHAQYFLKADDDTFVNLATIASILSSEPYISEDKFISGYIEISEEPQRKPEETFYISKDDYPADEYPPYASGSAFVMTIPTAIELFDASKEVQPRLAKDDVFLTGLCAQRTATPLIHEPAFVIKDPPIPPSWKTFGSLAIAHSVAPEILELVWKDMTENVQDSMRVLEAAINSTVLMRKRKSL